MEKLYEKISNLNNENVNNKNKQSDNMIYFISIKQDFFYNFQGLFKELTNFIDELQKPNNNLTTSVDDIDASPASIATKKIVNLDKNDSYLLNDENCIQLIQWIGKEVVFERIFKATKDGFSSHNFHSKCDKQGSTIVVVQNDASSLIGGYSILDWDGSVNDDYDYKEDISLQCFLFNLTINKNYKMKSKSYAISNSNVNGPKFGGGHDFGLRDGCDKNENTYTNLGFTYGIDINNSSKEEFYGKLNFLVLDYEVYKVIELSIN